MTDLFTLQCIRRMGQWRRTPVPAAVAGAWRSEAGAWSAASLLRRRTAGASASCVRLCRHAWGREGFSPATRSQLERARFCDEALSLTAALDAGRRRLWLPDLCGSGLPAVTLSYRMAPVPQRRWFTLPAGWARGQRRERCTPVSWNASRSEATLRLSRRQLALDSTTTLLRRASQSRVVLLSMRCRAVGVPRGFQSYVPCKASRPRPELRSPSDGELTVWTRALPQFGVGHSLGAKIHLLASSRDATRSVLGPRVANVLIAFNNYSASQSIPMWDKLREAASRGVVSVPPELTAILDRVKAVGASQQALEALGVAPQVASWVASARRAVVDLSEGLGSGSFTPDEAEVLRRAGADYSVDRNLVISYARDSIDCADQLVPVLRERFGDGGVVLRRLAGTHITPNTPDIDLSSVRTTGVDAVDASVRGAADSTMRELDATVTVIVAFIVLNLQLIDEQRRLPAAPRVG
jgi:Protein of unknown function (DUF1350)